jgi:hypothetical protein
MKETNTVWKPVVGYEGLYEVSDNGKVFSLKNKILLKPFISVGYYSITLRKNKQSKKIKIHRLVACAFLPNTENKKQVNHIDGNKKNNHVSNLEWCTASENNKHAWQYGLRKKTQNQINQAKSINSKMVIDLYTGIFYDSLKEACNLNNLSYSSITHKIYRNYKKQRFQYI